MAEVVESPLEDLFAWNLTKYLEIGTRLEKQVRIRTLCGNFRVDFLTTTPAGFRVAYECDGHEFHDQRNDEWRDAMILGANGADAIVRLRGSDLTFHLADVLLLLANWDPEVFSVRGRIILSRLISNRATSHQHDSLGSAMITYWEDSKSRDNPLHLFILRRNQRVPQGQREHWQSAYDFAYSMGGGNLEEIMASWSEQCSMRAVS